MKPLLLAIAGLHSFREEQIIDFTKLSQTGLFGIFGPTGSGKSTVLDALTLALYGNVERAKGGTQGIINQHEENAYVQFTFSMGEKKFLAERSFKRNKDGGVNLHKCRLIKITEEEQEVLAEKKKEMGEEIEKIIGLTADDFTRAVVLPQGKFAEFLSLQGKERRLMLQRLFSLEKYGVRLSEKVKKRMANAQNEIKLINSMQNELGDASQEAVKRTKEELQKNQVALSELKKQEKDNQKRYEELKIVYELTREIIETENNFKKLQFQELEIKEKQEKLNLSIKAEKMKPYLKIVDSEDTNLEKITKQLATLTNDVTQGENNFKLAQREYEKLENKIKTYGKELEVKLVKLEEALHDEETREKLVEKREKLKNEYLAIKQEGKIIKTKRESLEKLRKNLQINKLELNKLINEKEKKARLQEKFRVKKEAWQGFLEIEKRYQEVQSEILVKQKQLTEVSERKNQFLKAEKEIAKELQGEKQKLASLKEPDLSQEEINNAQNEFSEYSKIISTLEYYYLDLQVKEKELEEGQKEINQIATNLEEQKNEIYQLDKTKRALIEKITDLETDLKEEESRNLALVLREKLEKNKACPVCGSLDHPSPVEKGEKGDTLIKLQEKILGEQEKLNQLEAEINALISIEAGFTSRLEFLKDNQTKNHELKTSIIKKITKLRQGLKPEWIHLDFLELQLWQSEYKHYLTEVQGQISSYTQKREEINNEQEKITNKFNVIRENLTREKTNAEILQQAQDELLEKIKTIGLEKEKKQQAFLLKAKGLSGSQIEEQVEEIKKAIVDLNELREKERETSEQLDQVIENLFINQEYWQKSVQKLEALEMEGKGYKNQIEQLSVKINEVTKGEKVQKVKEEVIKELKDLNALLIRTSKQLEQSRESFEEKKKIHFSLSQELKKTKERLQKGLDELKEKLQELQFTTENEVRDALSTEEEMTRMEKEIRDFNEKKLLLQKSLEGLKEKLAGRSFNEEKWQSFLQQREKNIQELEEATEAFHKLAGDVERLEKNNIRWRELEGQKKEWRELLNKLIELEKLFRGNTFVEFIAEEQLINISLDASRKLADLTQSRYALVVDSEGGFIIRDDANGGLCRPVSTLSGGETFLTSLALALALSSQIQLKGEYPLEFFFLDEGFGTLDSYLLETVMNSLEKLQSEKMTIGVISHVPELKARMQRKLLVTPAEKGGKGTRLEIEVG